LWIGRNGLFFQPRHCGDFVVGLLTSGTAAQPDGGGGFGGEYNGLPTGEIKNYEGSIEDLHATNLFEAHPSNPILHLFADDLHYKGVWFHTRREGR
jgi:hypothetical protein